MRIAICDDERSDLANLGEKIDLLSRRHNVAAELEYYSSGAELLFLLEDSVSHPSIIYLDILMPGLNGIQIARELRKRQYRGEIIFISFSEQYAIDAFDVDALHYIIKAKTEEDKFEEIFLKATERAAKRGREVITVSCAGDNRVIPVEDILYFEVSKYVVTVNFGAETFEFYSTLGKIENGLIGRGFIRVHRAFLVAKKSIKEINRQEILLVNGARIPVGRNYWHSIKTEMDIRNIS